MITDPIADMLTRIRNAQMARLERTEIPMSRLKFSIAELLKREGFISDATVTPGVPGKLVVTLRYGQGNQGAIAGIRRKSRPGRRLYLGHDTLPRVNNGMGIGIVSTPKGVMTDKDARRESVGGELLCEVW